MKRVVETISDEGSPAPAASDDVVAERDGEVSATDGDVSVRSGQDASASLPSTSRRSRRKLGSPQDHRTSHGPATRGIEIASASSRASGIALIDPDALAQELGSTGVLGDPDEAPGSTSREDEERRDVLRRYADRPGGLFRYHLVANAGTIARLEALRAEAPNAAAVIDIVHRAALLSWHARSPLRTPPILIVGPPGTGKSRVGRRLAEALGTALTTIDGGATTDRGAFVGHDLGYRGSGPGKVARALLEGRTAGPLVLLDEIDKVSSYNQGVRPLDSLLTLLEPTTACAFWDTYIGLPMRAEGVQWVMTANSSVGLPAPLLDRVVVVEMPSLGRAETRDALRRMLAELLVEQGLPAADLGGTALDRLQSAGLRQARRTLALALGPALAAGRPAPDAADIASAAVLLGAPARRRGARQEAAPLPPPRPPVGFVHFPSGPSTDAVGSDAALPRRRR